ncbi:hypothetical protein MY4824_006189 [Beauveria thailandica]
MIRVSASTAKESTPLLEMVVAPPMAMAGKPQACPGTIEHGLDDKGGALFNRILSDVYQSC